MRELHRPLSALTAVALSALLHGCAGTPSSAAPAAAAEPTGPRLYVLDCGTIDVQDVSVFSPGVGKNQHKRLTDSCYVVRHPKGTLVWDTGLPDELAALPDGKTVMQIFKLSVQRPFARQLAEIGVDPDRVDFLGISHMHFDHLGNAGLFPKATLLIQKEEYDAAFGPEPGKYGFDPAGYPTLKANPVKTLKDDHDVFGDGTVVIKRALGHTPGHQALFLRLPRTGNLLLSGDLVHFSDNWEHKRVPGFNHDKEQSVKTMHEIEDFLKANKATLWIQHDLEQNAGIKHAPAYYE